jgi:hypothetical protein
MGKLKVAPATSDSPGKAKDQQYEQTTTDLGRLLDVPRRSLASVKGGFVFQLTAAKARALKLEELHSEFLERGCYVFSIDPADDDRIAILPTTDKYAVIAAMKTSGVNWNRSTADIVRWLRRLEKTQPFILTGISGEHVGGRFTTKLRQPAKVAQEIMEFSPDVADVELEDELRKTGKFTCWWT